jgi:hypothetical protein
MIPIREYSSTRYLTDGNVRVRVPDVCSDNQGRYPTRAVALKKV